MTPENFCYWLQGLLEVGDPSELNMTQVEIIKEHLNLVFKKDTTTPAKIKLSDYLLSPNEFDEKFKVKPTPSVPDYLNPWVPKHPTITC